MRLGAAGRSTGQWSRRASGKKMRGKQRSPGRSRMKLGRKEMCAEDKAAGRHSMRKIKENGGQEISYA